MPNKVETENLDIDKNINSYEKMNQTQKDMKQEQKEIYKIPEIKDQQSQTKDY